MVCDVLGSNSADKTPELNATCLCETDWWEHEREQSTFGGCLRNRQTLVLEKLNFVKFMGQISWKLGLLLPSH